MFFHFFPKIGTFEVLTSLHIEEDSPEGVRFKVGEVMAEHKFQSEKDVAVPVTPSNPEKARNGRTSATSPDDSAEIEGDIVEDLDSCP